MKYFSERARHRRDEGVGNGGPFGGLYPLMVSSGGVWDKVFSGYARAGVGLLGG
jgi:hypothetical protein